jgi:hypothetical protein
MTQEKPFVGVTANKGGIALQSSAPLYAHRNHDHLSPQQHEHRHDHGHQHDVKEKVKIC